MDAIVRSPGQAVVPFAESLLPPLQPWLPTSWLMKQCGSWGLKWRRRHWDPVVTFWACLYSALQSHCSVRAVEQYVDLFRARPPQSDCDGADFTRARLRLPQALFQAALWRVGEQTLQRAALQWGLWKAVLIDGTALQLPRTAKNVAEFGLARTGRGQSHLPLLRLVLLVCAETGAVLDVAWGAYHHSERALFRLLADRLVPGLLLIADRGFCSFLVLWYVQLQGCQYLGRLHQTRRRDSRPLRGLRDYRCTWPCRGARFARCPEWLELLPLVTADLEVRILECRMRRKGYRPLRLALCTTLLDERRYRAADLIELYCRRWHIETDLRHLKDDFGLRRLSSKTPKGATLETLAALIARSLVALAIQKSGCVVRRTSLRQVRRLIILISQRMAEACPARRAVLYQRLLQEIRRHPAPYQDRPPDPRMLVTVHTFYPTLSFSRAEWRRRYRRGVA